MAHYARPPQALLDWQRANHERAMREQNTLGHAEPFGACPYPVCGGSMGSIGSATEGDGLCVVLLALSLIAWRWLRFVALVALLVALPAVVHCQILPTEAGRTAADWVSWGAVGTAVGLDTHASASQDGWEGVGKEGARLGIVYAAGFAVKKLVGKERPCAGLPEGCGHDNPHFAYWSLHASAACQAVRYKSWASWALAGATMLGRVLAGKHDWWDVTSGCGAGLLAGLLR